MTISQTVMTYIVDSRVPTKDMIVEMREATRVLANDLPDTSQSSRLRRSLNDAYLMLQLARLADDPILIERAQHRCIHLIRSAEKG